MVEKLKKIWAGYKRVAHKIGDFQARVLLTLIYAVIVLPLGLAIRLFSDPLHIKKGPEKWLDHPQEAMDLKWARHQG